LFNGGRSGDGRGHGIAQYSDPTSRKIKIQGGADILELGHESRGGGLEIGVGDGETFNPGPQLILTFAAGGGDVGVSYGGNPLVPIGGVAIPSLTYPTGVRIDARDRIGQAGVGLSQHLISFLQIALPTLEGRQRGDHRVDMARYILSRAGGRGYGLGSGGRASLAAAAAADKHERDGEEQSKVAHGRDCRVAT